MDIQEIGAWGELLGGVSGVIAAIGVILTLLYLARQIRQNTEQARAIIAHNLMASLRDAIEPLTEPSNAEMYLRGNSGLENLTDSEIFQYNSISVRFHRVFEEAYLHYQAGRLEEEYWQSLASQHKSALSAPGIRQNWEQTSDRFNRDFKEWGDSLVKE